MKTVVQKRSNYVKRFDEIGFGDPFVTLADYDGKNLEKNNIYIKTISIIDGNHNIEANAVSVNTGVFTHFPDNEMIRLVKAYITLEVEEDE